MDKKVFYFIVGFTLLGAVSFSFVFYGQTHLLKSQAMPSAVPTVSPSSNPPPGNTSPSPSPLPQESSPSPSPVVSPDVSPEVTPVIEQDPALDQTTDEIIYPNYYEDEVVYSTPQQTPYSTPYQTAYPTPSGTPLPNSSPKPNTKYIYSPESSHAPNFGPNTSPVPSNVLLSEPFKNFFEPFIYLGQKILLIFFGAKDSNTVSTEFCSTYPDFCPGYTLLATPLPTPTAKIKLTCNIDVKRGFGGMGAVIGGSVGTATGAPAEAAYIVIERSDDGGKTFHEIGQISWGKAEFDDENASFSKTYYYRAKAVPADAKKYSPSDYCPASPLKLNPE